MENITNRYMKNILVENFGPEGQEQLLNAKVVVVGLGGLGSIVTQYLTAAGVGSLFIVDFDKVEISNLQRQILYREKHQGYGKAEKAVETLSELNSSTRIIHKNCRWEECADEILDFKADIIIDCVDAMGVKFGLNDFAVKHRIPLVHGGTVAMGGQLTTIIPGESGCLRCIFGDVEPDHTSSDDLGILGPVAGTFGSLQALEAIKYLAGMDDILTNKLLTMDLKRMNFKTIGYAAQKNCICKEN